MSSRTAPAALLPPLRTIQAPAGPDADVRGDQLGHPDSPLWTIVAVHPNVTDILEIR
jgi:hypothetical protein